jgi:hypothetical protein
MDFVVVSRQYWSHRDSTGQEKKARYPKCVFLPAWRASSQTTDIYFSALKTLDETKSKFTT